MQALLRSLSEHIDFVTLSLFVLLILCLALLVAVLINTKRFRRLASNNSTLDKLEEQLLAALHRQDTHITEQFLSQQQLLLHTGAESARTAQQQLETLSARLDTISQSQEVRLHRIGASLEDRLAANDQRTEALRVSLTSGLEKMQMENTAKLEQMRQTVDEKLHETLNRRLGESFSLVNERLEQVYKGLGEMQSLANGVGDLKRVLTNVNTRGIWGEMQLGALLAQMLAPGQYEENVKVIPSSAEHVEYAIRLPGNCEEDQPLYLPIDSKFPVEAYERLLSATEAGDSALINECSAELTKALKTEAARISKKYILPPHTTDFAIMFLSTEGLFSEALRSRGLMEEMQQKYRVLITGPSTLTALLSSLQVGFRTLAIEKRSAEVWQLLGAVKTEFSRFSDILDQTQQRLRQAGETIEKAAVRTRAINRRLREVETLEVGNARQILFSGDDE